MQPVLAGGLSALAGMLALASGWALFGPDLLVPPPPAAAATVIAPAERARLFATIDPFRREPAVPAASGAAQVTSLALVLFGTRATAGGGGTAIIGAPDGTQQLYRQGDAVAPGVQLARVAFDHVELARGGSRELLYLDQSARAPDAAQVVADHPVAPPAAAPAAANASGGAEPGERQTAAGTGAP